MSVLYLYWLEESGEEECGAGPLKKARFAGCILTWCNKRSPEVLWFESILLSPNSSHYNKSP